jgi:hypothetical protein
VVGPAGYDTTSGATMINDFTGAGNILTLGPATGFGATLVTPTTATMSVSLGGSGSGDIAINLGNPSGNKPRNFNVTDLKGGVTSVTVEFNFSEPLAAATSGDSSPTTSQPHLTSFRMLGSTTTGASWDADATYLGLRYTTDGTTFFSEVPGAAVGVDALQSQSTWGNDGASSSWTVTSTAQNAWQHINLFDVDASGSPYTGGISGDAILQDAEQVYATGIRYTFVPTNGGFLDGSNFFFSTNGSQWQDTFADAQAFVAPAFIPEPGTALLLALGLLPILLLRRRKRQR